MKKEQKAHVINVKYEIKHFYYLEKYRYYIKGRKKQFEKEYNRLCNIYGKKSKPFNLPHNHSTVCNSWQE